ncbi:MAG: hypothetical protein H6592_08710 [Flavobacteriales bacterium]|nr:hypothetical protein [Flavobacteriales bacterium]
MRHPLLSLVALVNASGQHYRSLQYQLNDYVQPGGRQPALLRCAAAIGTNGGHPGCTAHIH